MTTAEKQSFLADLHVGVLAIPRQGLGPLTVPVWYDYEPGGRLWFITGRDSLKGKLLADGVRISMCSQTEEPPYKYVSVEGPIVATTAPDDEALPMAIRYLGAQRGQAYHDQTGTQSDGGANVVVTMQPEHWLAVDYGKS